MFARTRRTCFSFLVLLFVSLIYAFPNYAQGVCPTTILRIGKIQGLVVTPGKNEDEPLARTKVELRRPDETQSLVTSTLTNDSGSFEMSDIRAGKYLLVVWLTVEQQVYFKYFITLNLEKRMKDSKSKTLILIKLGTDCFKSEASVINSALLNAHLL